MVPGQPLENYQDEIYLAGLAGTVPALPTDLPRLEDAARHRLSPQAWGYIAGGSGFASLADLGPEVLARRPLPGNGRRGQPGIGRSSGPETGNPGAWRPAAT
jgi:hypothetical protein